MSLATNHRRLAQSISASLTALALTVAVFAVRADTASATLLCETTACEPGGIYPENTALTAALKSGTLLEIKTSLGTVICKSSTIAGNTVAVSGEPLLLKVTALTFSECNLGKTGCTVTTTTLPTSPSLEATGEGDGLFSLAGNEVHFECNAKILNCTYAMPTLQFQGSNPASLSITEALVLTIEGEKLICPDTSKLTVSYTLSKPAPAYLIPGKAPVRLCDTVTCSEGAYPSGTALSAALEKGTRAKLLTSAGTLKCESSMISGKTTAEFGESLPLKITELAFGECELEGKEACTATTESLPTAYLEASGEGNGTLSLTGGEVNFKCGFFIRCTFVIPSLLFEGGSPASFGVAEAVLSGSKGLICPESAKFHVAYTLTKPTPAYLVEG